MAIPRMRTVKKCAEYLKENDPESCVGEWVIRKLISQKKISVIKSGNRFLINLDELLRYLEGEKDLEKGGESDVCTS